MPALSDCRAPGLGGPVHSVASGPLLGGKGILKTGIPPGPPNYPLEDPKYHLIQTIWPLIEVHWGV